MTSPSVRGGRCGGYSCRDRYSRRGEQLSRFSRRRSRSSRTNTIRGRNRWRQRSRRKKSIRTSTRTMDGLLRRHQNRTSRWWRRNPKRWSSRKINLRGNSRGRECCRAGGICKRKTRLVKNHVTRKRNTPRSDVHAPVALVRTTVSQKDTGGRFRA